MFPFGGWLFGLLLIGWSVQVLSWRRHAAKTLPTSKGKNWIMKSLLSVFLRNLSETKKNTLQYIGWQFCGFFKLAFWPFLLFPHFTFRSFILRLQLFFRFPMKSRRNFSIKSEWKSKLPNSPKHVTQTFLSMPRKLLAELDKKTYPVFSVKGLLKHTAVECYVSTSSMIWI